MSEHPNPLVGQARMLADKLNVMWGKHPDADLIREMADEIERLDQGPQETPVADPEVPVAKKARR